MEGEFMLNEFVDRFGPRMAHLNGLLQVLSQLSATPNPTARRTRRSSGSTSLVEETENGSKRFSGTTAAGASLTWPKNRSDPFLVWSGLGPHFGLGEARGKIDRKAAVGVAIALAVVILILLILQKGR